MMNRYFSNFEAFQKNSLGKALSLSLMFLGAQRHEESLVFRNTSGSALIFEMERTVRGFRDQPQRPDIVLSSFNEHKYQTSHKALSVMAEKKREQP